MTEIPQLAELGRAVSLQRRRGDAAAARERSDEARQAYCSALSLADQALESLGLPSMDAVADVQRVDRHTAEEAAEWFGVRGGILRRLSTVGVGGDLSDALESYRHGAAYETAYDLPTTYNRGNAIKFALIAGVGTLGDLRQDLVELRDALVRRSAADERAADDAWLWADLGDVLLLLGETDAAMEAYAAFAAKARTDSPASTLSVFREIVSALRARSDPDAERIAAALDHVETTILSR